MLDVSRMSRLPIGGTAAQSNAIFAPPPVRAPTVPSVGTPPVKNCAYSACIKRSVSWQRTSTHTVVIKVL
ncbi:hypothetical protein M0802_014578 [Mischocyttarus mexicanus]|nr:hypothetical protein M0802_014578 [Mischocyttarus mexicanus]